VRRGGATKRGRRTGKGTGKGKGKDRVKVKGNPTQPRGEQWGEELHPSYYGLQNPLFCASSSTSAAFARVTIASDGAAGQDVRDLKVLLKKSLDPASFKTYWKYLMYTPDFLSKAFQPGLVKSAFKTAGIHPFNAKKILSVNPHFRTLSTKDAQLLVDNISELAESFTEYDMVPEFEFDRMLENEEGQRLDNVRTKDSGKPLNEMVANRQRCGKINGKKFMKRYRDIAQANQLKAWEAKKSKALKVLAGGPAGSSSSSSSSAPAVHSAPACAPTICPLCSWRSLLWALPGSEG
jgi:hypothetical protein